MAAGWPLHLRFAVERIRAEQPEATPETLASIPFFSLCKGLFLPLTGLATERAAALFGFETPSPRSVDREGLVWGFLERGVGLDVVDKLACVLGDPFRGRTVGLQRDSLLRLLMQTGLVTRRSLLDRLAVVGDPAALVAQSRSAIRGEPHLSAAEVLTTLRFLPDVARTERFALLRSLLERCGKLEAFFLARLVLRKAGFGFEYQGPVIARVLARLYGADADHVAHAMALTDAFHVVNLLRDFGPDGLKRVRLQALVPVHPALAGGTLDTGMTYPMWVERKYDGVRFMLHKSTDSHGAVLVAAYTRNRRDWLEMVPGLDKTIRALPVRSAIVDGELYGFVSDGHAPRPATVYEVFQTLQGETKRPARLRFAAFDLPLVDGVDLTGLPLHERRRRLAAVVGPWSSMPLPVQVQLADGQTAQSDYDVNRLYEHFRSQGYEGVVAKDLNGTYLLSQRDPTWRKRKPEVTLDLVLLGAVFAVTGKENVGLFGSYVLGARAPEGAFVDVGDVAGVDRVKDSAIQAEIAREGLLTGRRIERQSAAGRVSGLDLRPHIVVTVRFEGLVKDGVEEETLPKLRDPKIVAIRADKGPFESDSARSLEALWIRQRMG